MPVDNGVVVVVSCRWCPAMGCPVGGGYIVLWGYLALACASRPDRAFW